MGGLLLAVVAATACGGDDKPKAAPTGQGVSGGGGAPVAPKPESTEMVRAWSFDTTKAKDPQAKIYGSWTGRDGRHYIGTEAGLSVLNAATGQVTGTVPILAGAGHLCGMAPELTGPEGNIGLIASADSRGDCTGVSALDVNTGKMLWTSPYTSVSRLTKTPSFGRSSQIVVAGNVVLTTSQDEVTGFDLTDGRQLWKVAGTEQEQTWSVTGMLADADRVLVSRRASKSFKAGGLFQAGFELIDVHTGKTISAGGIADAYDDTVYPLSLNPLAITHESRAKNINDPAVVEVLTLTAEKPAFGIVKSIPMKEGDIAKEGETYFDVGFSKWGGDDAPRTSTRAVVDNGVVYSLMRFSAGKDSVWGVAALDLATGKYRWKTKLPPTPKPTPPPGKAFAANSNPSVLPIVYRVKDGSLYVFAADDYLKVQAGTAQVLKYSVADGTGVVARAVHDVNFDLYDGLIFPTATGFEWINLKADFGAPDKKPQSVVVAFTDK